MIKIVDTFQFFLPVETISKSKDEKDPDKRWIQGIASTPDKDLQDEKVIQKGIDLSYFLQHGWINDDHKTGPEHKVGEPTEARITDGGLWVKAFLYKNHDRANYWWELMNALEISGSSRKIGFSIQGKVTRRDGNSIMKCWLTEVAITACPVNTHTWAEISKSLSNQRWCKHPWKVIEKACKGCAGSCPTGIEDEEKALTAGGMGRGLIPQSLEGRAKVTTYKSNLITYDDAIIEAISKGYSPQTAKAMVDVIFKNKGL